MKKRAIELNNGRAAMMGILALMVHCEIFTTLQSVLQFLWMPSVKSQLFRLCGLWISWLRSSASRPSVSM